MRALILLMLTSCAPVDVVCEYSDGRSEVVQSLSCADYREHGDQVIHVDELEADCEQDTAPCSCEVLRPASCRGEAND